MAGRHASASFFNSGKSSRIPAAAQLDAASRIIFQVLLALSKILMPTCSSPGAYSDRVRFQARPGRIPVCEAGRGSPRKSRLPIAFDKNVQSIFARFFTGHSNPYQRNALLMNHWVVVSLFHFFRVKRTKAKSRPGIRMGLPSRSGSPFSATVTVCGRSKKNSVTASPSLSALPSTSNASRSV